MDLTSYNNTLCKPFADSNCHEMPLGAHTDDMAHAQVLKDGGIHITGLEILMGLLTRLKKHGVPNANTHVWDGVPKPAGRSISSDDVTGQNELSELRRLLDEAKLCLAALNDVQDYLAKRIEHLQKACIPMVFEDGIKTLPNEILSQIFEHGHDMTGGWTFAKCVSQVSHRFRQVSLRTPLIWSRISSFCSDNQVEEFLSRSREMELDVVIAHDSSKLTSFANILRPHLHRCGSLELSDAWAIERLDLNDLPRLRVLCCPDNDIDLSLWHLPSLSSIQATEIFDGPTGLYAQLTSVDFTFSGRVDIVSFSKAVSSMTSLNSLSVGLVDCNGDFPDEAEIPRRHEFHTVHIETLDISFARHTSRNYATRLYDALGFLFPSTVQICMTELVDEKPLDFLCNSAGIIFPYGSIIKIRLSSVGNPLQPWDNVALLPTLVAACDVAHTMHIEAPMATLFNHRKWYNDRFDFAWKIFASLRHLRLGYCDQLDNSEVQLLADNLIGAEPDTGLQSLEILCCRNVSEKFMSELATKVGPKLRWKL